VVGALDADLKRVPLGECIVIGTATDPYQPAERRFRVTRAVLQRLTRCEGLSFGIITKSRSSHATATCSCAAGAERAPDPHIVITHDAVLARKLEARSPVPPRACARCGSWSMPG